MKHLVVFCCLALVLCSGCAGFIPLSAQGMSSADTLEWMKMQNARGCMYVRASTTTFASASFAVVGTWGSSPPPYNECFNGLPTLMGVTNPVIQQGTPLMIMPDGTPLMLVPKPVTPLIPVK